MIYHKINLFKKENLRILFRKIFAIIKFTTLLLIIKSGHEYSDGKLVSIRSEVEDDISIIELSNIKNPGNWIGLKINEAFLTDKNYPLKVTWSMCDRDWSSHKFFFPNWPDNGIYSRITLYTKNNIVSVVFITFFKIKSILEFAKYNNLRTMNRQIKNHCIFEKDENPKGINCDKYHISKIDTYNPLVLQSPNVAERYYIPKNILPWYLKDDATRPKIVFYHNEETILDFIDFNEKMHNEPPIYYTTSWLSCIMY